MDVVRKTFNNFLFIFSGQVLASIVAFVSSLYLARVLGPSNFGKISFAYAVLMYLLLLANMGLETVGTREIARDKLNVKEYIGNIISLRIVFGIFAFVLSILLAIFIKQEADTKLLIVLYSLSIFPSVILFEWIFQGLEVMKYNGIARFLKEVIYLVLVLLFIQGFGNIILVPWFEVLARFLSAIFLIFIFIKYFGVFKLEFNYVFIKKIIENALPIGYSLIMAQIFSNSNTILLGFMRTDSEVGNFNAAYKIIIFIISLCGVYYTVLFPLTSNYFKTSMELLKNLLSFAIRSMIIVAIPIAVGGTILAGRIMTALYGVDYSGSIIAFQILIWSVAIIYINTGYSWGLLACDDEKGFLMVVAAATLTNIIFNFILIPRFGIIGAGVAAVITEFCGFIITYRRFSRIVKIKFTGYLFKPFIASVFMGIFLVLLINFNIVLLILLGTIIYVLAMILIKGLTLDEILFIKDRILLRKTV